MKHIKNNLIYKLNDNNINICVVGLGYVGLPLANLFSNKFKTFGYDIDNVKLEKIRKENPNLYTSNNEYVISFADIIIICVPTPIKGDKEPDLYPLESASMIVGRNIKKGSIVVYESTVYPGCTEEICIPILEKYSKMKCGYDFSVGYSPERVCPGDDEHVIEKITKVVSGTDEDTCNLLCDIYGYITKTHPVSNIKTAEASKIIENIQRDINIAFVNELSMIFNKIDIDTNEVLSASSTKWNFHRYEPGMVGGHCIPVDPYYFIKKVKELGCHPKIIMSGRGINDNMPRYIVEELVLKSLIEKNKIISESNILILGLTYKENISDIRESPSKSLIYNLKKYHIKNIYG